MEENPPACRTYEVFGVHLASNLPLPHLPLSDSDRPDLEYTAVRETPQSLPAGARLRYASQSRTPDGESLGSVYRVDDCDIVRLIGVGDFYVWPDRIVSHSRDAIEIQTIEIHLLATVLTFWLERQGYPVLHACAVATPYGGVACLAHAGNGKSTLAASLVQAGYSLLTDDVLPLEESQARIMGRPGYPTMRMWPREARYFLGSYEHLERVHPDLTKRWVPIGSGQFGTFCAESQPLVTLYVVERHDPQVMETEVKIIPFSPREALIELIRYSFVPRVVEALGWQAQRVDLFARLVQQVPMRRLIYPAGYEHLPRVREAVLADLERLDH